MAESKKEKLMRTLGISAAEAEELMAYDEDVQHDKKTEYDLTPEQEANARKYRQADREKKPFIPDLKKRERKPNEPKREIIKTLQDAIDAIGAENVEITNIERQIDFVLDGIRYRIVLSAPRK